MKSATSLRSAFQFEKSVEKFYKLMLSVFCYEVTVYKQTFKKPALLEKANCTNSPKVGFGWKFLQE